MNPNLIVNVPKELQQIPQWVLWAYEERDGKPTKVPYQKNGHKAKADDQSTWDTFQSIYETAQKILTYEGIGFEFSINDFYCGIDLDDCIDEKGTLKEWGKELVNTFDSYCEISPSGTGIKIWVKAKLPTLNGKTGKRVKWYDGEIEIYDHGRYFTVTGNSYLSHNQIKDKQTEINDLWEKIQKPKTSPKEIVIPILKPSTLSDSELIDKACNAKNGDKFRRLWNGQHDGDDSRADMALCSHLAFWTNKDEAQIDCLFRQSGLMRDKWERSDYRTNTINKAIINCQTGYNNSYKESEIEIQPIKTKEYQSYDIGPEFYPDSFWTFHDYFYRDYKNLENQSISATSLLCLTGILLGKHVYSIDFNLKRNYSALSCINLDMTGGGKGPVRSAISEYSNEIPLIIGKSLSEFVAPTQSLEAYQTFLGGQQRKGKGNKPDEDPVLAQRRVKDQCEKRLHGQLIHLDEAQDNLKKILQKDPNGDIAGLGQFIDTLDSGTSEPNLTTIGNGWRGYFDSCIGHIFYANPRNWNKRFDLEKVLDTNLTARYLMNTTKMNRKPINPNMEGQKVWNALIALLQSTNTIVVNIPEAPMAWGDKTTRNDKQDGLIAQLPEMILLKEINEKYYRNMVNKISRVAGCIAQIWTWIDHAMGYTPIDDNPFLNTLSEPKAVSELNGSKYFTQAMRLVVRHHVNYVLSLIQKRENEMADSILNIVKVQGIIPEADLWNIHFGFKRKNEILDVLTELENQDKIQRGKLNLNGSRQNSKVVSFKRE